MTEDQAPPRDPYSTTIGTIRTSIRDAVMEAYDIKEPVEVPIDEEPPVDADLATPVAMSLAKEVGEEPREVAEKIVEHSDLDEVVLVDEVKVEGPGFINVKLDRPTYSALTLRSVFYYGPEFGSLDLGRGRPVILEHTSANPNGPLHLGHGRNAIIGDVLGRCLVFTNYDVEIQYYVNDMGKQIAMLAWKFIQKGRPKVPEGEKPDHFIGELYVEAAKDVEEDPELEEVVERFLHAYEKYHLGEETRAKRIIEAFQYVVDECLKGHNETLARLKVAHDRFVFESEFVEDAVEIVEKLLEEGLAEKREDGAVVVNLEDYGIDKELVLTRSDGTTLYTTRDIAYHLWKLERAGVAIDVLGADHKLAVQQLKAVLDMLGENPDRVDVVFYEFIHLPEGSMSTRKGRYVTLDEFLDEAKRRAMEKVEESDVLKDEDPEEVAEKVAIGAVRFAIAKVNPNKPIEFDWEKALDFRTGGPFIQYAYARAKSILDEAEEIEKFDTRHLTDDRSFELIYHMSKFPRYVAHTVHKRRPDILAEYTYELAKRFNSFYEEVPVLKEEDEEVRAARIKLVEAFSQVMENAMNLLGIPKLERM
ncbi:MAG: arginine--tRNA ligase [Methanopyri archaeon]|nr:arginine--tRNA ligase [Methanopyri archaeon]